MVYLSLVKNPELNDGVFEEPYWLATRNADYYGRAFQKDGSWTVEIRQGKKDIVLLEGADELSAIKRLADLKK
jgi:hypothetical protein